MELWLIFSLIGYMIGAIAGIMDKYMMNQQDYDLKQIYQTHNLVEM